MQRYLIVLLVFIGALLAGIGLVQARVDSALENGQRLAEQGDVAGALAAYQEVALAKPDWAEAQARLGSMQLVNQRYGDAVRSFQKAVSLGDQSARPFVGMGMAYLHMGEYGPARAAFGEAKIRGAAHAQDIERLLQWLDSREARAQ